MRSISRDRERSSADSTETSAYDPAYLPACLIVRNQKQSKMATKLTPQGGGSGSGDIGGRAEKGELRNGQGGAGSWEVGGRGGCSDIFQLQRAYDSHTVIQSYSRTDTQVQLHAQPTLYRTFGAIYYH